MNTIWPTIVTGLMLSAPLILAALGGLTSERSGVMNIALEGKMLLAACVTALVAYSTHSALLGMLGGISASVLLSLFHGVLTQAYRMDHIVSGMAINALALGGTQFMKEKLFDPAAGEILQLPLVLYYGLAFALPFGLAAYVARTRGGWHLWAVGNNPDKSRQMGLDPVRVRYTALIATGVFCGLAGALIVSNAGRFEDGMTSGRGFIALAALILGGWRAIPALGACLVFGMFDALQLKLQSVHLFGTHLPSELWNSLPYLVTLLALALLSGKFKAPSGLGKP